MLTRFKRWLLGSTIGLTVLASALLYTGLWHEWWIPIVASLALCIYLAVVGWVYSLPANHGNCNKCGHDLTGNVDDTCPKCEDSVVWMARGTFAQLLVAGIFVFVAVFSPLIVMPVALAFLPFLALAMGVVIQGKQFARDKAAHLITYSCLIAGFVGLQMYEFYSGVPIPGPLRLVLSILVILLLPGGGLLGSFLIGEAFGALPVTVTPTCTTCGYNLTGNVSGVCPECGKAI